MLARKSILSAMCVAGLLGSLAAASHAAFDTSGVKLIVANTGQVIVTFAGSDAGDTNLLFKSTPGPEVFLFNNKTTPVGTTVNLGTFSAGTELVFRLANVSKGYSFFTGPGTRNPDGVVHAGVDLNYAPGVTLVGFEDRIAGDFDYNDTLYTFTNIGDPTGVPEPGVTAFGVLAAGSVLGLIVARKRKSA